MDFSSTVYDSTQQDTFYPPATTGQILSTSELSTFVNLLLSTLDIEPLGAIYFQQISRLLPISSFSLSDLDSRWVYGKASISSLLIEMSLDNSHGHEREPIKAYYYLSAPLSLSQRNILTQLHGLFAKQFSNALAFHRMHQMATKDMLTSLGNRSGFDQALTRQLGWAQRHNEPFALLIIDLDNFKSVNDTYGHRAGDKVLIKVAAQLNQVLRDEDEAFRFGGDEFCCLLDCQTELQLKCAASRIQLAINQSTYLNRMKISCSLGGTIYRDGDSLESIFDRADNAMYCVKHSGKNNYQAA